MNVSKIVIAALFKCLLASGVCAVLVMANAPSASAQMFGQRSMGQPLSRRPGPSTGSSDVGTLRGNERFMRDNRARNDFVGSSRTGQEGFVGSEQAIGTGRVPTAAESVRSIGDASRRVNRPIPPLPANQPYYPSLVLVPLPETLRETTTETVANVRDALMVDVRLSERLSTIHPSLQVFREGPKATIVGNVSDSLQAARARLLLSFEPGVYSIVDSMVIQR